MKASFKTTTIAVVRKSNRVTSAVLALTLGLACVVTFGTRRVLAQAPVIDGGGFFYEFSEIPSDGSGGYQAKANWVLGANGSNAGMALNEGYKIPPPPGLIPSNIVHLEAHSNATGTSFWTTALGPVTSYPVESDWNVGGNSELDIALRFTKDSENASLEFTITKLTLNAFGAADSDKNNSGLLGEVAFNVGANMDTPELPGVFSKNVDRFITSAKLSGWPTLYNCETDVGSPLNFGVTQGGTGQEDIVCSLKSPFKRQIDLSDIPVGDDFVITYTITATAIDTIQQDTFISALGRDPLDPDSGVQITYEGLTPVAVPIDPTPPEPVILSPTAVLGTDMGTFSNDVRLENMIDHSGMDPFDSGVTLFDEYVSVANPADGDYIHTWQSDSLPGQETTGSIDFDFGEVRTMDRLAIWNGKIENMEVLVADSPDGPWQSVGEFTLATKLGIAAGYGPDILEFSETADAQYLRVEVNSVYPLFRKDDDLWYAIVGEVAASVLPFAAVLGDFNANGILDAADIDLLTTQIRQAGTDSMYDVNIDGFVDGGDLEFWVHDLKRTYFGDSNLDSEFGTGDLTLVLVAGEFQDGIAVNSTWEEGDWDGNGDFETGDIVKALQDGGFGKGPRVAVQAIPEPSAGVMCVAAMIAFISLSRSHQPG